MLRFAVGDPAASQVALTGALYEAPAAAELGLVDALVRVTSYWRRPDRAPWH
jgi:enoyl-CoA hydratase/carnithine racemase